MAPAGMELLADLRCQQALDDPKAVHDFALGCVAATGLRIVHWHLEEFSNGSEFGPGITALALLAESHLAIHTTPQDGMLYIDLFSCKAWDDNLVRSIAQQTFQVSDVLRWDILWRGVVRAPLA